MRRETERFVLFFKTGQPITCGRVMQLHTQACPRERARTDKGVSVVDSSTSANGRRHAKEIEAARKKGYSPQTNNSAC